jgi:FkbM family methyltransferase
MSVKETIKNNLKPRYLIHLLALKNYLFGEPELKFLKYLVDSSKESIDIGAANGIYTYFLSRLSIHVHSYEPNPIFYEFIRQWAFNNISASPLALSDHKGKSIMSIPIIDNKEYNKEGRLGNVFEGEHKNIEVATITLDEFGYSNIGFIKIDAEGYEENILNGGSNLLDKWRPNLLIEIEQRHRDNDIYQTFSMIENIGYEGYFLLEGRLTNLREFSLEEHQLKYLSKVDSSSYINNFIFIGKRNYRKTLI